MFFTSLSLGRFSAYFRLFFDFYSLILRYLRYYFGALLQQDVNLVSLRLSLFYTRLPLCLLQVRPILVQGVA